MRNLGSLIREDVSSLGKGSASLRNTNRGWAFFPFTSSFSRSWNFGSKPFPGRTYFRDGRISSFLQFSCRGSTTTTKKFVLRNLFLIMIIIILYHTNVLDKYLINVSISGHDYS